MKQKITLLFLFLTTLASAQISYSGFIDKYPIDLMSDIDSDGAGSAIYTYSNFDTPIVLEAKLKGGTLIFIEKDKNNKETARLTFKNYNAKSKQLIGTWKDLNSEKELSITLSKNFDINSGKDAQWSSREILQPVSLKGKYFKLIVSKAKGDFEPKVIGVKILEKKTDNLIQKFDFECQFSGINDIEIEDYNFDGIADFSVFEAGSAGPDSSRLYFLYNPATDKYFESSFSGSSLEFDSKTKRIQEHSECCGGARQTNAEYKVVNNKMVLIKKTCLEYDEKLGNLKKVKCD